MDKLRLIFRWVLRVVGAVLLALVALVLHLPTEVGRKAVRDVALAILPGVVPGQVSVRSIDEISLRAIRISGLSYRDDHGARILDDANASVGPTIPLLRAALTGSPFPPITVHARKLWARQPYFKPRPEPADPTPSTRVTRIPSLAVTIDAIESAIPEVELTGRALAIDTGFTVYPQGFALDLRHLGVTVRPMGLGDERIDARASVSTREPLRVNGAIHIAGDALRCDLAARTEANNVIRAEARECVLAAEALDQILKREPENRLNLRVALDEATVQGPARGPWVARVAVRANDQPVEVDAHIETERQTADVHLHHLALQRVVSTLPASDIDGDIHLERAVIPTGQRVALDTTRLVAAVNDVPIPPVEARARIEGDLVTLEDLRSRPIGLTASGALNRANHQVVFDARAHFDVPDLAPLPWVAGRVSGGVRLDLTATGRGEHIAAALSGEVRNLRVDTVRAKSARVDARASYTTSTGAVALNADVGADALRVQGSLGPTDVSAYVSGDPRGELGVSARARGDGLLAALGPAPRGTRPGNTEVTTRVELDLGASDRIRVRLRNTAVTLRGAQANLSGDLDLLRGASRGALPVTGRVSVATPRHGSLGVNLTRTSAALEARAFDLAWLRPLVPSLSRVSGVIDGDVRVDPRRVETSTGTLRVTRGDLDPIGAFEASVEIAHAERALSLRVALHASRGGDVNVSARVIPPRGGSGADAWVRGVQGVEVTALVPELHTWEELFGLSRSLSVDGSVNVRVTLQRARPADPLAARAYVEGRGLTAGTRAGGRVTAAVVPLHLRALACAEVRRLVPDEIPIQLRVALAPERPGPTVEPTDCVANELLLENPLVAFQGGVQGPWESALTRARADLATASHQLTPATQGFLQRTRVEAHVRVGPIRRSEWPLRDVSIPNANGRPTRLPAPDVPMDTTVAASIDASGALAGLGVTADVDAQTSRVPQVGLLEPVRGRVHAEVRPGDGGSLLGPLGVTLGGLVELSPEAPLEQRGQVALDVRATAVGRQLLGGSPRGLRWVRFDVDSRHIRIERFAFGRDRGLAGDVGINFVATSDSENPIDAHIQIDQLRARVGTETSSTLTPPIQAVIHGKVIDTGVDAWVLRTCVAATPTADARERDCDPMAPATAAGQGSLRAVLALPLAGAIERLDPRVGRAQVSLKANRFRLAPFSPVVSGDTIGSIDGLLDADLDWSAADPGSLHGRIALIDGATTVVSLGEPLRRLNLVVLAQGSALRFERFDVALGRGTLRVDGGVDLAGFQQSLAGEVAPDATLAVVDLHGVADGMPIGTEGNTYGWIDGSIRFRMTFKKNEANGNVTVERAAVLVKEQSPRELQALAEDPDVFIYGRTEVAEAPAASWYPLSLGFEIQTPVWLRRSDFAIALRARGSLRRDRSGWGIAGTIEHASSQNWVSVFGKRFAIDRIGVVLDGGVQVNPQLDIAAHHDSPSVGRLTIGVRGHLQQPVLEFGSVNYPAASQAEVLAMIILGRRDSRGSSSQSGDLASQASSLVVELVRDLAVGTATANLQQRYSFLPTLIVEPGERQQYGAGVSLGPRFYLQATYGTASNSTGVTGSTSAQQLRVLLEIAMSSVWSTAVFGTIGTSGQQPGTTGGGVDVFWSP